MRDQQTNDKKVTLAGRYFSRDDEYSSSRPSRGKLVSRYFKSEPEKKDLFDLEAKAWFATFCASIAVVILFMLVLSPVDQTGWIFLCVVIAGFSGYLSFVLYQTINTEKKVYDALVRACTPRATDKQMDDWLSAGINFLLQEAKQSFLPDNQISNSSIAISVGRADTSKVKMGQDGRVRCSLVNIQILALTNQELFRFQCLYDLASDQVSQRETQIIRVSDVTSLGTSNSRSTSTSESRHVTEGQFDQYSISVNGFLQPVTFIDQGHNPILSDSTDMDSYVTVTSLLNSFRAKWSEAKQ